jgi:hypothetical protein
MPQHEKILYKGEIPTSPSYSLGHLKKWSKGAFLYGEAFMARGTKNYFRHHNNAFFDEKIQKAISLIGGFEAYAYYFIIIELLAKQCENEFKNPIKIHKESLRSVLRKQSQSCNKVLTKLQQSGLFVVTFGENFYEFDIPNLSKYMGKYESKNDLNVPNKRKENKRKEKEIKIEQKKSENFNIGTILENWNIMAKQLGFTIAFAPSPNDLNEFNRANLNKDQWDIIFSKIKQSDFLSGKSGILKISFSFMVQKSIDILNGKYDSAEDYYSEKNLAQRLTTFEN